VEVASSMFLVYSKHLREMPGKQYDVYTPSTIISFSFILIYAFGVTENWQVPEKASVVSVAALLLLPLFNFRPMQESSKTHGRC